MDIGAMSIALNQGKVQNAVSLALMKKVMTTSNVNMDEMIKMIEAVDPNLGNSIDVKA
ncbi:MAG: YjfB family protein [Clostridium argentinense]|uniref:YjfB family protein n=1 Tax=Clostridium faecium TaxID=2762223 RepID=A0ABR8YMI2_9CLOT|nr:MULTISPECIES: YjfB family protein [Clostridium]MBD8045449.1 YjfB family protein [Clostridium faecium]MBS5824739.1 YjfB family protein [Clostridium argentinense]MDU1348879.1 YjfB family protein [Clostridium argentinense]